MTYYCGCVGIPIQNMGEIGKNRHKILNYFHFIICVLLRFWIKYNYIIQFYGDLFNV